MNDASQSRARIRIASLLDANSFAEIGAEVTARSTDFNLSGKKAPSDGVVTGYGQIDGRPVYIYSQDASVLGGSMGEMHAGKIVRLYEMAMRTGDPVIGLLDCAGMRLEEGLDGLYAFGGIYRAQAKASGIIPQIAAVFGMCGGGMSVIPAFSDFTFMEEKEGRLFLQAPNAIPGNTEEACNTSGSRFNYEQGNTDMTGTEEEILQKIRELLSFLPSNNEDDSNNLEPDTDLNAVSDELGGFADDPMQILLRISDHSRVFESRAGYAPEMVTAFIRLGGYTAGVIANRKADFSGAEENPKIKPFLTPEGASKAARFLSFCDAFSIPVVTLVNVSSMESSMDAEKLLPVKAAALAYAAVRATNPKISLVTGEAYGTAGLLMNSRALGADLVFAWDNAEIGVMPAASAAKILAASQERNVVKEVEKEYEDLRNSTASAAARGYVDAVIAPSETRKYLIGALDMLYTKRPEEPYRKHSAF